MRATAKQMPIECTKDVFRIEVMLRKDAGQGGCPDSTQSPSILCFFFLQIPPEWSLKQTKKSRHKERKEKHRRKLQIIQPLPETD